MSGMDFLVYVLVLVSLAHSINIAQLRGRVKQLEEKEAQRKRDESYG